MTLSLEQQEGFCRLDQSMQVLAMVFKEGKTSIEDLVCHLHERFDQALEQVSKQHEREKQEQVDQELRNRFLERLRFADMNVRIQTVEEAYEETFRWVFDQPHEDQKWSNFGLWLENGGGTFWISGKAGSGKSTLMNFIVQNPETKERLDKWAGLKKLLRPFFFFWASGSPLQRSVEGFLRSLAYQIIKVHTGLIPLIIRQNSGSAAIENAPKWTEKALRQCIQVLVREVTKTHRICFFFDGLDEFEGDHDDLLEFVEQLVENPDIKCCFSSRPERAFEDFMPSEMLRLQDLTESDIKKYIDKKLARLPQIRKLPPEKQDDRRRLRDMIAAKAEGVFLWVALAVKSQIIGVRNRDSLEKLEKRLLSLPNGIEDLYTEMLGRIDKNDWEEVAWYLKFALYRNEQQDRSESSVYLYTIAKFGVDQELRITERVLASNIRSLCSEISERINICCKGFLEVQKSYIRESQSSSDNQLEVEAENIMDDDWRLIDYDSAHLGLDWASSRVIFFHRTAGDYFKSHPSGQSFLAHDHLFPANSGLLIAAM